MHDDLYHAALDALNARLLQLERRNRCLAWAAAVSVAGVIVIITAGAMPARVPDKIEAKEFVLRSPDGKVIAELGADPLGDEPYFQLFDKKGDVRFAVDTQSLAICKRFGDGRVTTTGRIILSRLPDGECSLLFRDGQGRSRLQVGVTKDDSPALEMWDRNLSSRIRLALDQKSDAPFVTIGDGRSPRIVMGLTDKDAASVHIRNSKGDDSLKMQGGGPDGNGNFEMFDGQGKKRVSLKVEGDGSPNFSLYDKEGKQFLRRQNY